MEQVNVVVDAVRTFLVQLSAFLPKLLAAVVILIAGIVTALAISFGLGGQKWAATQLEKFMKDIGKKS